MNEPHDPKRRVFSTAEVRQAVPVGAMRYVLGIGIAGVVVGFLIAWMLIA